MAHYPRLRPRLLGWLPARCACGLPRFDRCPDAVADAICGAGAPRGGPTTGASVDPAREYAIDRLTQWNRNSSRWPT